MSIDDEIYSQPRAVGTELITDPDGEIPYTSNCETDVRGALLRGLAEYLMQLRAPWRGGVELRLLKVHDGYAEPEELAKFPSAAIYTEEAGQYDSDALTTRQEKLDDGQVLRTVAGFIQNITIDVWTTSEAERRALIKLIEDALDPVDWMSGFHLRLPHYHNVVATYLKDSINVADAQQNVQQRLRLASFTVGGACPQLKLIGVVPGLDPRVVAEVEDS